MRTSEERRVPSTEWDGRSGFQRFGELGRFAVPDAQGFRASWRSVSVDGVRVGEWTTSPVSGATPARPDVAGVTMAAVVEGSMRYWANGAAVDARSGSVHLISGADAFRFAVPETSRFLLIEAPAAFLPPELRPAVGVSIGQVPSSRITAGLTALVEQVLDPLAGGPSCAAARAVRAVAVAAIEDSAPTGEEHDLRGRIVDHIERRIGDPDLGPQSIAAEYGISLRWVHHIFNVDGSSVARYIRERRLDIVAAQLRTDRRLPRIGALAERTGFGSRDQLTRAFKARFGTTIAEYAALADLGRAPEPVGGGIDDDDERIA